MQVNLTGGAYQNASLIAGAQRCVNLRVEYIPAAQGEPLKAIHHPTPGLLRRCTLAGGAIRGAYAASNGDLYAVAGPRLYYVAQDWTATFIAALTTAAGPVSMADNTRTLAVVDGSARGADPYSYAGGIQVDLATRTPEPMPTEADGFYGADRVDYLATFLVFNKPGTPQFYASESGATTFYPAGFANKAGASDPLAAVVAVGGHLLLVGSRTCEPWALTVAPDLPIPFQPEGGVILEHGCAAAASITEADGAVFMLSQNRQGRGVVLRVTGGQAERVSTHAIEGAIAGYDVQGAWGGCYQDRGHTCYVLGFAEATWVYDLATQQWHEWVSLGADGQEEAHRGRCFAYAYGRLIVGDREDGTLYEMRQDADTDDGRPIRCIRGFPHLVSGMNRVSYTRLVADVDVSSGAPGDLALRYSNDRGKTFSAPMVRSLNAEGSDTSLQFWRLGMARDRVFELSWDARTHSALAGAFIEVVESAT